MGLATESAQVEEIRVAFDAPAESAGMCLERVARRSLPGGSAPFSLSRFQLQPGARSPLDRHAETELWLIATGRGTLSAHDGAYEREVAPGEIVAFSPEVSHTLHNTGSEPLLVFAVWWDQP
jgi:mannose-6-phosphate isomerase-like protein (cupin superfamily)